MRSRNYFKKAMASVSAFAIGATTLLPAIPVQAADITTLTKDEIAANDYVLYTVNCGTPDPTVVPNQDQERMGLLQSSVDQDYGTDAETGTTWGCDPATAYSQAVKSGDDATDIGNSFVYMDPNVTFDKYKSSLGYSFQVPEQAIEGIEEDTYEVTVAFKHYWDGRNVNISLENQTVAADVELGYGEWVSRTFTTKVTDGELNVDVSAPRRTGTNGDPVLNFIKVRAVEDTDPVIQEYSSFTGTAGETMYDTNGNQIQAHGGQIQQLTVDGVTKWYWIGEDKTNDYRPVGGIHVYSSEDLYNWDDEGVVLQTMENPEQFENDPYFNELYGELTAEEQAEIFIDLDKNNTVMERPKMLYNDKTGKYVIWFHADGRIPTSDADYGKAKAGVAISDSPTGPFKLLGSYKLHHGGDNYGYDGEAGIGSVRDMNLFKDDDGTAYVIYSSEGNQTTYISKLNEEYTGLSKPQGEAVEGEDFTRNFAGWSREAPTPFKYKDKYYIVNSGCTGWSPNPAEYFVADAIMGPYTPMGDPCTDWGSDTTYDTQSTCVFPVDAENGKYIYMGDRWNAGDLSESRYVWLPVEFQPDNKIALRRYENWTLEDLEGKGTFDIVTTLPETVASTEEISSMLPDEVTISYGTQEETTPVTWDTSAVSAGAIGTVTVTGTLTEKDRTVTHEIHVVNPDTMYFFDSHAEESEYFNAAKTELGTKLLNTAPEQKYAEDTKAGYLGVTQEENSEAFDLGTHDGNDMWENGWWANSGKNIEYAFDLEAGEYTLAAGFQEWWNTTRGMKLTVSMGDTVLAEQDFTLESTEKDLQVDQPFTVAEAGTVTVSISKTGDSDPVISWIGLMGEGSGENPDPVETTDKTSLNLAITMAEEMAKEQEANGSYTDESWAAVETALSEAKALQSNPEATQEQIDEAFINLINAYNGLENKEQKVGLKAAIDGATAILADTESLSKYTEESVAAVRTALAEAESVYADDTAAQETVNAATTKLLTAVNCLLAENEDVQTRLDLLIDAAKKLLENEAQYTPSSVQNLKDALAEAEKVAANSNATEEEQKAAYDRLAEAMTSLVRKANKSELENALNKANEILSESGKYLESSMDGLQAATDAAQEVYDNADATQDEIGEVLKVLIKEILEVRLMGDVDLNGTIDTQDAAKVLKYNVELEELTEEQQQVADVNGDGEADSSDAGSILQYSSEKITEF